MRDIGRIIKERRLKKGFSQEDLAEQSKINLRTIQRIENNETTPRRKTLDLIFKALDIEVIEKSRVSVNKYLILSSVFTSLIFIFTFLGWSRRFKMFVNGEPTYKIFTGWVGYTRFNDYNLPNWLLSITCISVGVIVISNSLGLLKNKMKYILVQLGCLLVYQIGFLGSERSELRPGLFLVVIITVLLVVIYKKMGIDTDKDKI